MANVDSKVILLLLPKYISECFKIRASHQWLNSLLLICLFISLYINGNRNFRRDLLSAMATPKVPLHTHCIIFVLDTSILIVDWLMICQIEPYDVLYQYIVALAPDRWRTMTNEPRKSGCSMTRKLTYFHLIPLPKCV